MKSLEYATLLLVIILVIAAAAGLGHNTLHSLVETVNRQFTTGEITHNEK